MIPDGILDRDLDSCIKIRIEFPFSRLSINCVKRNGNNHPGQRSFRGQIKVIYESSRNILPTDVWQTMSKSDKSLEICFPHKLWWANQNAYTQSDKRNFLFVFIHVFGVIIFENILKFNFSIFQNFWRNWSCRPIIAQKSCHHRISFTQHLIYHMLPQKSDQFFCLKTCLNDSDLLTLQAHMPI